MTALGVLAAVLALAAGYYGGLRVVVRFCGEKSKRRWRDAADECTEAAKSLREARSGRKAARTCLADAQRGLNRAQRGLRTVGGSGSFGTSAGGDPAHADMVRTAEQAVTDAVRALAEQDATVAARRNEMTARRQYVRACAMDACVEGAGGRWRKCRQTVKEVAAKWRDWILGFVQDFLRVTKVECEKLLNLDKRYYWGIGTLLTAIAVAAELLYFRHFDVNMLQFYSSASLSAFMSAVLESLFVAVLVVVASFAVIFVCLCAFLTAPSLFAILFVMLPAMLQIVLSALPWMACHSTLCARLAAPRQEDGIDG